MTYTKKDLYDIGRYCNLLPYLIPLSVAAHLFPPLLILSGIVYYVFATKLSKADKYSRPWLWGLVAVVPIVGFVCAFVLVGSSLRILKENGVKAGIAGVRKAELQSMLDDTSQ